MIRNIRSRIYYNIHLFSVEESLKYGLEKSIILENVSKVSQGYEFEELYKGFPYIEKTRFYLIISELISDGLLKHE